MQATEDQSEPLCRLTLKAMNGPLQGNPIKTPVLELCDRRMNATKPATSNRVWQAIESRDH